MRDLLSSSTRAEEAPARVSAVAVSHPSEASSVSGSGGVSPARTKSIPQEADTSSTVTATSPTLRPLSSGYGHLSEAAYATSGPDSRCCGDILDLLNSYVCPSFPTLLPRTSFFTSTHGLSLLMQAPEEQTQGLRQMKDRISSLVQASDLPGAIDAVHSLGRHPHCAA